MKRILIAGPRSGVGKTTITLGLLAGLGERGLTVQPFKVGPDYIDLGFHAALTRRPCYNLDGWLMPGGLLVETFVRAAAGRPSVDRGLAGRRGGGTSSPAPLDELDADAPGFIDEEVPGGVAGLDEEFDDAEIAVAPAGAGGVRRRGAALDVPPADVAVVEGMMGLYDGVGSGDSGGSSADIARRLGLPVVLVLDVHAMAGSAGAAALGYRQYDEQIDFAGVILNNVAGEHHARACAVSLERVGIPILGVVPVNEKLRMPDRHLGLIPAWERHGPRAGIEEMALEVASHLDLDALLDVADSAVPHELPAPPPVAVRSSQVTATLGKRVRIGIARDDAFGFYYQDTLDMLAAAGAELVVVRPTRDEELPPDLGGLYLGGGFPERHLEALEANVALRDAIRARADAGMPMIAECGGLMYLCASISMGSGRRAMVGVFDGHVRMGARQAVAYVEIEVEEETPLAPKGTRLRGHVFHNSVIERIGAGARFAYRLEPGPGIVDERDGWVSRNVLASYAHLPLAAHPELVERWLEACRQYRATAPRERAPR